jgi:hypothetical protein
MSSKLPADWTEAVERIQTTINAALESLDQREVAFGESREPKSRQPRPPATQLNDSGGKWKIALAQATRSAQQADAELSQAEGAVQKWHAAREKTSQNLARWDKS